VLVATDGPRQGVVEARLRRNQERKNASYPKKKEWER
jgi:hypothetical protein